MTPFLRRETEVQNTVSTEETEFYLCFHQEVQFGLVLNGVILFAFPLSEVVNNTKTTDLYRPVFWSPFCWGTEYTDLAPKGWS